MPTVVKVRHEVNAGLVFSYTLVSFFHRFTSILSSVVKADVSVTTRNSFPVRFLDGCLAPTHTYSRRLGKVLQLLCMNTYQLRTLHKSLPRPVVFSVRDSSACSSVLLACDSNLMPTLLLLYKLMRTRCCFSFSKLHNCKC